jgi:hypothetical protein
MVPTPKIVPFLFDTRALQKKDSGIARVQQLTLRTPHRPSDIGCFVVRALAFRHSVFK